MIICDASRPQGGDQPYYLSYIERVDGYLHAWFDGKKLRHGRTFNHPPDPRCPECAKGRTKE